MDYIDTSIIDCSREAASVKNETNPAQWINHLNNTIELEPGDKVSMYSSFISERGAGQSQSVELRGETIGTKEFTYTKLKTATTQNYAFQLGIDGNYQRENDRPFTTEYEQVTEKLPVKDNEIDIVISYYKTMDLLSYVQLPRRFITSFDRTTDPDEKKWSVFDSITHGRTNRETIPTTYTGLDGTQRNSDVNNTFGYILDDFKPIYSRQTPVAPVPGGIVNNNINAPINNWCQKNDNTRYTVMIRKKTQHSIERKFIEKNIYDDFGTGPELFVFTDRNFTNPYYARDPEYFDYVQYKKKITLNLDKGFNSSSFIASEVTRQLGTTNINPTNIVKNSLGDIARRPQDDTADPLDYYNTQINYPISKSVESKTYNTFPCINDNTNDKYRYRKSINNQVSSFGVVWDIDDPTTWATALEVDPNDANSYRVSDKTDYAGAPFYESQQFIACKRPEIYEEGSKLNDIYGLSFHPTTEHQRLNGITETGVGSFQDVSGGGLATSLDYNEANCKLLKNFVESQEKYPELFSQENIINMYQDNGVAYSPGPPVVQATSGESVGFPSNPYYKIVRTVNQAPVVAPGIDAPPTASFTEQITMNATIQNSRFFHMNCNTSIKTNGTIFQDETRRNSFVFPTLKYEEFAQLGSSYYDWIGTHRGNDNAPPTVMNRTINEECNSFPFLVYYDPTQKDTFYDRPQSNQDNDPKNVGLGVTGKFTYGFIGRADYTLNHLGVDYSFSKCVLFPNKLLRSDGVTGVGLPSKFFQLTGGIIEWGRKLGFDRHFNAWGTCMINLSSGIPTQSKFRDEFSEAHIGAGIAGPTDLKPTYQGELNLTNFNIPLAKTYLGADKFNLGFDGQHFFFSDLHTALNKGDLANSETGGQSGEGGLICYKINPEQHYNNFSPVQFPYEQPQEVLYQAQPNDTTTGKNITRVNQNVEPWAIYDTTTGIFIEDFGYDLTSWDKGLWKKLGFSYNQLHDTTSNRFTRYSNSPQSVSKPTTNAKIDAVDTKEWNQNQFFNPLFDGTIGHSKTIVFKSKASPTNLFNYRMLPQITITDITSIQIVATDYPITSFKGYYTIRSDLISDTKYKGNYGDTALPVIGVTDKIYPVNDFITGSATPIQFTITAPRTLASIETAITDPDGKYSVVDGNSSILYKIERIRKLNMNVIDDIKEQIKEQSK